MNAYKVTIESFTDKLFVRLELTGASVDEVYKQLKKDSILPFKQFDRVLIERIVHE